MKPGWWLAAGWIGCAAITVLLERLLVPKTDALWDSKDPSVSVIAYLAILLLSPGVVAYAVWSALMGGVDRLRLWFKGTIPFHKPEQDCDIEKAETGSSVRRPCLTILLQTGKIKESDISIE